MPSNEQTIKDLLDTNEFELPIGYTDSDGTFHKTVKLQEMTGEVDEALGDAKVRQNAGKMLTEALNGVVERIGTMKSVKKEDIRKLFNPDRDFILLMNHLVSIGEEIEWTEECPSCGKKHDIIVNINNIPVKYMAQDESKIIEMELPNGIKDAEGKVYKKIKFSLPTGEVQERIFPTLQVNPKQAVTHILNMTCEDIVGLSHWNPDTFKKMTKKDRTFISKKLAEIEVGPEMSPKVTCASCSYEYESTIPVMTLLGE
jgi:hypothetical protein